MATESVVLILLAIVWNFLVKSSCSEWNNMSLWNFWLPKISSIWWVLNLNCLLFQIKIFVNRVKMSITVMYIVLIIIYYYQITVKFQKCLKYVLSSCYIEPIYKQHLESLIIITQNSILTSMFAVKQKFSAYTFKREILCWWQK